MLPRCFAVVLGITAILTQVGGAQPGLRCEKFETLQPGNSLSILTPANLPTNTWQPPDGDFWGRPFTEGNGTVNTKGTATIVKTNKAGGTGHEVKINNLTLCFSANFGQVLKRIRFSFGEYGGNLNLRINRKFVNFKNFKDIHGQIIGGVKVNVISGGSGNDKGVVEFTGTINDQRWWGHLAIGGQELWIDDLCWE